LALARAATVVMSCGAQNDPKLKADAEKWADDSLALLTAAVKVPGEPERFLTDIADLILTAQIKFGADRGLTVDKLYAALDGAFPNRAAWLVFKGHQYMLWAWDARGMGYANTVTPQGWRLMAQRLDLAEAALTKAYELDPSNPAAAVEMLAVVMGQNKARDVMEQWFQRAITADPDSLAACQAKLLYLEPKWHGSAEEMLAFGRQCLATRNWRGGIANMLIIAHMQLASYASNKEAYWHDPKVWDDISAVAARCVELHPENTYHRSVYAYWAWKCGRWDIANYQFKQLGDKVDLAVFGNNPAELARAKAESVANASVK
jgi:tetratricopeptide (TPR) repeat protein